LAGHNRRWIVTDTINRYYWSCWLPMVSVNPLVKIFSFLTDSIDHRFEKKFIFFIESNHRLKIFFLLKTFDLIDVFLQVIDYWYRSNLCFFCHRCPPMSVSEVYKRKSCLYNPPPRPTTKCLVLYSTGVKYLKGRLREREEAII
jgi:hypothetical protein